MADKIKKPDGNSTGFSIPKIKRSKSEETLRTAQVGSRDAQDLMKEFDRSFLDASYKDRWELTSVEFVDNSALEMAYRKKRAELKDSGRNARELVELLGCVPFKKKHFAVGVAKEGLLVKGLSNHYLGDSEFGVHVCKHGDVVLRSCESAMSANIMVFKITLGRCKAVVSNKSGRLEPTPNYDCHVSSIQPKSTDSLTDQLSKSQIYLYEYDEDAMPSRCPRHCLPHAVLRFDLKRPAERHKMPHLPANPNFISPSAASAGWASSRWIGPETSKTQVQEASCVTNKGVISEREPNSKSASVKTSHLSVGDKFLQTLPYQDELLHHGGGVKNHVLYVSSNSGQGHSPRVRQEVTQMCNAGKDKFSQVERVQERTKETSSTIYHTAVCSKRDPRLKRHSSDEPGSNSNVEGEPSTLSTCSRTNLHWLETESSGQISSGCSKIRLAAEQVLHRRNSSSADYPNQRSNSEVDVRDRSDVTSQNFKSPIQDMIKKVNKLFGRGELTSDDMADVGLIKRNSSGLEGLDETDDSHPFNSWGLTWKGDECHFSDKELSGPMTGPQTFEKMGKVLNSKQDMAVGNSLKTFGDRQDAIPANNMPILNISNLASLHRPSRKTFVAAQEDKKTKVIQAVESVGLGQTSKTIPRSRDLTQNFIDVGDLISSGQKFVAKCTTTAAERNNSCKQILKLQHINGKIERSLSDAQTELASMGQLAVSNSVSTGKIDVNRGNRQKHFSDVKGCELPTEKAPNSMATTLKPALKRGSFSLAGGKGRKKLSFNDYKQMREKLATQERNLSRDEEQEIYKADYVAANKVSDVGVLKSSTGQEPTALIEEQAETTQNAFELLKSFSQNAQRSLGLFSAWKETGESGGAAVTVGEGDMKHRDGESDWESSPSQLQRLSHEVQPKLAVASFGTNSEPLIKVCNKDLSLTNGERSSSSWSHNSRKNVATDETQKAETSMLSGFVDRTRLNKLRASDSTNSHSYESDPGQLEKAFSKQISLNAGKHLQELKAGMLAHTAGGLENFRWKQTDCAGSKHEGRGLDTCSGQHGNSLNCSVNSRPSADLSHSDVTLDMTLIAPCEPKLPTDEVFQKDMSKVSTKDGDVHIKPSLHSVGKDGNTECEATLSQPVLSDSEVMARDKKSKTGQQSCSMVEEIQYTIDSCKCNVILEKSSVPSSFTENLSKNLESYSETACKSNSTVTTTGLAFDHGATEEQNVLQSTSSHDENQNSEQYKATEQGRKKRKTCSTSSQNSLRTSAKHSLPVPEDKEYEEAMVRLAKGLRPRGFIHVEGLGKNPTDDPLPVLEGRPRMKKLADKSKNAQSPTVSYSLKKSNENDLAPCSKQEKSKKKQGKGTSSSKTKQQERMNVQNIIRGPGCSLEYKDIIVSNFQFDESTDFSVPICRGTAPCSDSDLAPSQHKHVCKDVFKKEEGSISCCDWSGDEKPDEVKQNRSAASLGINSWTDALVKPSLQPQVLLVDLLKAYVKGADFENCSICQKVIDLSLVDKEDKENASEPQNNLLLSPAPCLPDLGPVPLISQIDSAPEKYHLKEERHNPIEDALGDKEMTDVTLESGNLANGVVSSGSSAACIPTLQGKQGCPYFDVSGGSSGTLQASSSGGSSETLQATSSEHSSGTLRTSSSGASFETLQAASSRGNCEILQASSSGRSSGTLQAASSRGGCRTCEPLHVPRAGGSPENLQAPCGGISEASQAASGGGCTKTIQAASRRGSSGTLQAPASGGSCKTLEVPALLVQNHGQSGTILSGTLAEPSVSFCARETNPLYTDTDGFWLAPFEASPDISERSASAEVDCVMNVPRSLACNIDKADEVSCKEPENENAHKHQRMPLKEAAGNLKETMTCLSNSLKDADTDGFWIGPGDVSMETNEMDSEGPEKETVYNHADTDGFWLAPVEASPKTNRHSVMGEVDSAMDVTESCGENTVKSGEVNRDRPEKETPCNQEEIVDSQMETLVCSSNILLFTEAAGRNVNVSPETVSVGAGLLAEKNAGLTLDSRCVLDTMSVLPGIHKELEEDNKERFPLTSKNNSDDVCVYDKSFSDSKSQVVSASEIAGESNCNTTRVLKELGSMECADMDFQDQQVLPEHSKNVKRTEQRHSKIKTVNSIVQTSNRLPSSSVCSRGNSRNWQEWKAAQQGHLEDENLRDVHSALAGVRLKTEDHHLPGASVGTSVLPSQSPSEESAPAAVEAHGSKSSTGEEDDSLGSAFDSSSFFDVINTNSSFLSRSSIPGLDLINEGDGSSVQDVLNFANKVVSAWKDREIKNAQRGKRDKNAATSLSSSNAGCSLGGGFQQGSSSVEMVCGRADQKIRQESTGVLNGDETSSLHSNAATPVHQIEAKQEFSSAFSRDMPVECRESQIPVRARAVGISCPLPTFAKEKAAVTITNDANSCEEKISVKISTNFPLAFNTYENVPLANSCQRLENQVANLFPQQPIQSQPMHTTGVPSENLGNRNYLMPIQQNSQHQSQFFPGKPDFVNLSTDHLAPYYGPGLRSAPRYVQPISVFHQAAQLLPNFPFLHGQNFSGQFPREHLPQIQHSAGSTPFPAFPVGALQRHSAIGIVSPMVQGTAAHKDNSNFGSLPSPSVPVNTSRVVAAVNQKQSTSCSVNGSDVYSWFSDILSGKRSSSFRDGEPNAKVLRVAERDSNFRSDSPVDCKPASNSKDKTSYTESSDTDISDHEKITPGHSSTESGHKVSSLSRSRTKHADSDDWMDMLSRSKYRISSYSKPKGVQSDLGSLSDVSTAARGRRSSRSSTVSEYAESDSSYHLSRLLKDKSNCSRRTDKHSRSSSSSDSSDSQKGRSSRKRSKRVDSANSRDRSSSCTRTRMKHSESERLGCDPEKLDSLKSSSRGSSKDLRKPSKITSPVTVVTLVGTKRHSDSSRNKNIISDSMKISDIPKIASTESAEISGVCTKKGNTVSKGLTTGEVLTRDSEENSKKPISVQNQEAASLVCEQSVVIDDFSINGELSTPAVSELDRLHISGFSESESVKSRVGGSDISELGRKQDSKKISRWDQKNKISKFKNTSKDEENGDLDGFAHELLEAEMEPKTSDFSALPASDIATAIISLGASSDKHLSKGQKKTRLSLVSKQVQDWEIGLASLKAYKGVSRSNSDSEESTDWRKVSGDDEIKSVDSPQPSESACSIASDTSLEALSNAREKILLEMKNLEFQGEDKEDPRCETFEEVSTLGTGCQTSEEVSTLGIVCHTSDDMSRLGTDVPDIEIKVREEDMPCVTRSSYLDSFAKSHLKTVTETLNAQNESATKISCSNLEKSQSDVGFEDLGHKKTSERPHTTQPDSADGVSSNTECSSQNQCTSYSGLEVGAQNEDGAVISRSTDEHVNSSTITEEEMSTLTEMILKQMKTSSVSDQAGGSTKASDDPTCSPNNRNNDGLQTCKTKSADSPLEKGDVRKASLKDKHASLSQGGQIWSDLLMSERNKYTPVESLQQNRRDTFLAFHAKPIEETKDPQHITTSSFLQRPKQGRKSLQARLEEIFETVELSSEEKHETPPLVDNIKKTLDVQSAQGFLPQRYPKGVPHGISETLRINMNKDACKPFEKQHKLESAHGLWNTLHSLYEQHLETFSVDQIETELGLIQECSNLLEAMQKKQIVDQFENGSHLSADCSTGSTLEGSQRGQLLIQRSCLSRPAFCVVRESLCAVASDFENSIKAIKTGSVGGCHQCVPKPLLLPDELDKFHTKEGAVLILLLSIPRRQHLRLQQLRNDIVESVVRSQQFAIQNDTFGITQERLRQMQLKAERSTLLTTFTGRFNFKRLQKLQVTISHYDNCHAHLDHVLGKESLSKMSFFLSVHQAVMRHLRITEGEVRDLADVENS